MCISHIKHKKFLGSSSAQLWIPEMCPIDHQFEKYANIVACVCIRVFVFIDVFVHVQCVCICVFVCVINQGRKSRPRWSFASHYDREEEKEEGLDATNGADITNPTPLEKRGTC